MKRILSALLISSAFGVLIAFAGTTPTPTVDEPASPVDADRAVISGLAVPGATVTATGGAASLAPTTADGEGLFSFTVELTQETTNVFTIYATDGEEDRSEAVIVEIVEGEDVTREYEEDLGVDRTAPDVPVLDLSSVEVVDSEYYDITGTGEPDASVILNGELTIHDVDKDGEFSVRVTLSNGGVTDRFYVGLQDASGNMSGTDSIEVTGLMEVRVDDEEEDERGHEIDIFPDTENHWARDYIDALYNLREEQRIIEGFPDGFRPDEPITRGALLKIALLAFEINVDEDEVSPIRPFKDVPREDWTARYVDRGYELGIVEGEEDGDGRSFYPRRHINRAAAVKIILESAGITNRDDFINFLEGVGESSTFPDIERGVWFEKYALYAAHRGWMQGDEGRFLASRPITRGEVAKIVMEVVEWLEGEGSDTEPLE